MKATLNVHFICSDMRGTAASVALLAYLSAMDNDDLLRLRVAIDEAPSAVSGLLAWLDHAIGWEQDRRTGYSYPLRGPTVAMRDVELADRIAAVELLATTCRDDRQIGGLMDLVSMIFGSGGPLCFQQPRRNPHKPAA